MRILVTGATGYVGGRLTPRLVTAGHDVTVLVRDRGRIRGRTAAEGVSIIEGDLLDPPTLAGKLQGFDAAFYLVHSMLGGHDFHDRDLKAADHFIEAASDCGHAIYLGGLMPKGGEASLHLRSRAATGQRLREGFSVRFTEFRAGPIIGSGSASFEMVRYLTERLPIMVTPRWVRNEVQPIAIRDVLAYMVAALETGPSDIIEIGADRMTFAEMMNRYAACRGLRRRIMIPTPVLAPAIAARWVGFFTPIPNRLAVPLVRGLVHPLLADTTRARELFPQIRPIDYEQAVTAALQRIEKNMVETRWSGALGDDTSVELADEEGVLREVRQVEVDAPSRRVFDVFTGLGGKRGWLCWNWAWTLRGWMDKLIGGPGLRRGRRDPRRLLVGETVDFWRVERIEEPHLLRLRAEMKLPGKAWLQWEATDRDDGGSTLTQTALFESRGLLGPLYWYALYPLHGLIFGDMVRAIAREARQAGESR